MLTQTAKLIPRIATLLTLLSSLVSVPSIAQDTMQLVVTGSDRAIILFNSQRLVLKAGINNNPHVKLLEADSERAVLSIRGEKVVLETDSVAAPVLVEDQANFGDNAPESDAGTITLWADSVGFFYANGSVNRRSARFLVDTGANTVTFSSAQADRLGINYKSGRRGYASTASGITPTMGITLDNLTIEGISLRNIAANVILGNFPETPLLGGSFLSKLEMSRSGKKMELRRR